MKQLVDYMVAALVLLLCCPLLLYIAIRIRMQGAGSVFYQQERLGKGGVPFRMVKFRTMVTDAENGTPLLAVSDDQRVTAFGRTLRKHHLDELPQFWNILKGDMSLVGTRPPTVEEFENYDLKHKARLGIKPGLTGMWQVSGRSDIKDFEEVVGLDTYYIAHWDLGLDIKILLKTIKVVVTGRGSE